MADPEVLKIFDSLKKLHEAKDADYAGGEPLSNFKRCEQFGIPAWKGVAVRLSDKWSRFVSLAGAVGGEGRVTGENLDDTLADLAVYAVICLALRRSVVIEEQLNGISISGDRVKRGDVPWNDAKLFAEREKKFAEADKKRRNYAGIND